MEESMTPVFVLENFENTIDSELGPITTDEDVEKCMHPVVYDTKCCGVECSRDEKYSAIITGAVCGAIVGYGVTKSMIVTHNSILDGIKLIAKCISHL